MTSRSSTSSGSPPQSASTYLSYPVSQVVSGLYRRLADSSPNRLSKLSSALSSNPRTEKPSTSTTSNSSSGVYTPPNRIASPFQPPPLTPLTLCGYSDVDTILTKAIAEEIRLLVPPRLQLAERWRLVYSLERDGVSLGTLYNKCADPSVPSDMSFVLVVQDGAGGIFGAYLTDPPRPQSGYYGTGECFLWRASILPSMTLSTQLLANLPPPPSAPDSETKEMGRSTTIASPTSPRSRTSFSKRRRSSAVPPPPSFTPLISGPASTTQPKPREQQQQQQQPPLSSSTASIGTLSPDLPPRAQQPSPAPSTMSTRLRFKAFPYSGINDYLILCDMHYLSVGGGDGRYGLWLDEVLENGVSQSSLTFGNEGLSDEADAADAAAAAAAAAAHAASTTAKKTAGGASAPAPAAAAANGRLNAKSPTSGKFEVFGVEIWGIRT